MIKLSDIQSILLSSAAQRADGSLLPAPGTLVGKNAAVSKALASQACASTICAIQLPASRLRRAPAWLSSADCWATRKLRQHCDTLTWQTPRR